MVIARDLKTFVVPTRTLLEQTVRELTRLVPGVRIGSYGAGRDHVVPHGVNVTTYAMLQAHAAELPVELRRAALVFVDEAHHAMTTARSALLATAFDRLAVRVALTATPDYDAERQLERFFPDLVHKVTLEEALALGLLAAPRSRSRPRGARSGVAARPGRTIRRRDGSPVRRSRVCWTCCRASSASGGWSWSTTSACSGDAPSRSSS